jgi:hypothetical protein
MTKTEQAKNTHWNSIFVAKNESSNESSILIHISNAFLPIITVHRIDHDEKGKMIENIIIIAELAAI